MRYAFLCRSCFAGLSATLLLGSLASAQPGGGVALTSDYVYRGASQTDGGPAIQGHFSYEVRFTAEESIDPDTGERFAETRSAFYADVWASNVDFNEGADDPDIQDEADLEMNITLGFYNTTDAGLSYEVGGVRYLYPDSDADLNYNEYFLKLAFPLMANANLKGEFWFTNDLYATDENGYYFKFGGDYLLPQEVVLDGHLGYSRFDEDIYGDDFPNDYWDWRIAVSREFFGINLELAYTDTNGNGAQLFEDAGARGVFTLSREF